MQIKHSLTEFNHQPLALTIGNFDGVHIGHQAIFSGLVQQAREKSLTPAAMTFSPHAKALFEPCENYLINSDAEKAEYIAEQGIVCLYQIPFDQAFSQIAAENFIDLLIHQLKVKYLLVGDDFRFGYRGQGDFELLFQRCQSSGVIVEHTPTITYADKRVSSSRIRKAIQSAVQQSDFDTIAELLGRRLCYQGTVIAGNQLGRTIDFPTANIRLPDNRLLPNGVFAVRVKLDSSETVYQGMCNIGRKPTIGEHQRQIEVHLFDFNDDLYGKALIIEPVAKIRDEQKFASVNELVEQLRADKINSLQLLI